MKKNRIIDILFGTVIIILISLGYYVNRTFNNLQHQIDERDSLLLSSHIKVDSLKNQNTDIIKSLNKLFKDTSLIKNEKFDVLMYINHYNSLRDSIKNLNSVIDQLNTNLNLIQSNYGITTKVKEIKKGKNHYTQTSIEGSERIDSGLMLLPFFRDRLKLKADDSWNIDTHGVNYKDLINKYNRLIAESKKEKLFYDNLLKKIAKKNLIKIDTLEDGTAQFTF